MSTPTIARVSGRRLAILGAVLLGALLLPALALADPKVVPAPAIPGVAALPGPVAAPAAPAQSIGIVKASVDAAPSGKPTTLSATGLQPNKTVTLVWMTSTADWVLDARADSVDYTGRKVTKFGVVLGTTQTDSNGSFSYATRIPQDFGGLHDVYAVVDGLQVAKGGILITRTFAISPKRGPIGTTIHVKITGLGSSLYESGAGIYYDNKFAGVATANWTRGTATISIRAAGPVGQHTIESSSAMMSDYLNPDQSPIPWANLHDVAFTVTKDAGAPKNTVEWPASVAPTVDARTTLSAANLSVSTTASARLSVTSGYVLERTQLSASGLTPNAPVSLLWGTVVGNRVNCTGTCWSFVTVPLGSATASSDGTLGTPVTVPDGLGGWHVVQIVQDGAVKAQVPFFVTRNLVGIDRTRVKAGQQITIHLKGVGWTQLDNTAAVLYDNSYIGYGCGFNSQGDVLIKVTPTGAPGTHLIDLYPLLYTQNPVYPGAAVTYGMVPFLSFTRDEPGLAVGYRLPAFHLAITIVK